MKDGEVRDAVGIMSGIDLAASFARVYFGEENEIEGRFRSLISTSHLHA